MNQHATAAAMLLIIMNQTRSSIDEEKVTVGVTCDLHQRSCPTDLLRKAIADSPVIIIEHCDNAAFVIDIMRGIQRVHRMMQMDIRNFIGIVSLVSIICCYSIAQLTIMLHRISL